MRALSDVLPLSHIVGRPHPAWLGTTEDPGSCSWPLPVAAAAVGIAVLAARRRAV